MGSVADVMLWVAAIASLVIATLGTMDALSTLVLDRPARGVLEATELFLVVIVFMSQPYLVLRGAHIWLDLLKPKAGSALQFVRAILTYAAAMLCYGLIAWTGIDALVSSWSVKEQTDGVVLLPVYPVRALLVLGATTTLLFALIFSVRWIVASFRLVFSSGEQE